MYNIPCIIFAGGKSSRMGEDKALLPFANFNTLTEYQLTRLKKIFKTVYISCKNKDKFNFDANFIEDVKTDNIFAPTTGFISVFNSLHVASIFVISVDSPFVDESIIQKLLDEDSLHVDATIAKTEFGIQPMCGIYHNSLHVEFKKMLKDDNHKLGFLLKNANTNYVTFKDSKAFLNLNNPDEYKEALTLI